MPKNGTYAVWFKTPRNEGAGVVTLSDGVISGGDSILTYTGAYENCGNQFTAVICTVRHSAGHDTMFGIDNLTLRLSGSGAGKYATFQGEADEVPGIQLEGTLILSDEKQPDPEARVPTRTFNIDRLPKFPPRSR